MTRHLKRNIQAIMLFMQRHTPYITPDGENFSTWGIHWLIGVLLVGWAVTVSAVGKELAVTDDFIGRSLAGYIYFLDDPKGELNFPEVLTESARRRFNVLPDGFERGYTTATSWLRTDLVNPTIATQERILRFTPQMLDHVDVYIQQAGPGDSIEDYRLYLLGDHAPTSVKRQIHQVGGVAITLPPGQSRRIYIRVQTTSSSLLGLDLMTPDIFARSAVMTLIGVSGYVALAFGLALVTLMQAVRIKDLTHALYTLVPLGLGLNSIGTEGLTAILLPGIAHRINDGLVGLSYMLIFGGLSVFAMRLFKTTQHHRWGHYYLQMVTLLALASFLVSGTVWNVYIGTVLMTSGLLMWVFLTWAGLQLIDRGEKRFGRLFLVGFSLPLLGTAVTLSRYIAWLPHNEATQYFMPATSLIHMAVMNLALTERLLESESQLRETKQLAMLERIHRCEQEQLLSMISHEIRTPIAVIGASNESLQVLDPSPIPERVERYERIERAVRRLSILLDLTVVEGQINLDGWMPAARSVCPSALCAKAARMLDYTFEQRIQIQILSADSLPLIIGDERMLCFALLNLLDNACRYSPLGAPVRVAVTTAGQGVLWEVADQGPGIPPDKEADIFKKYSRISEASGEAGLGLGLYLARQIALTHGGLLRVKPNMVAGSCFQLWLPEAAQQGAPE